MMKPAHHSMTRSFGRRSEGGQDRFDRVAHRIGLRTWCRRCSVAGDPHHSDRPAAQSDAVADVDDDGDLKLIASSLAGVETTPFRRGGPGLRNRRRRMTAPPRLGRRLGLLDQDRAAGIESWSAQPRLVVDGKNPPDRLVATPPASTATRQGAVTKTSTMNPATTEFAHRWNDSRPGISRPRRNSLGAAFDTDPEIDVRARITTTSTPDANDESSSAMASRRREGPRSASAARS
jgi:hypothetical protein